MAAQRGERRADGGDERDPADPGMKRQNGAVHAQTLSRRPTGLGRAGGPVTNLRCESGAIALRRRRLGGVRARGRLRPSLRRLRALSRRFLFLPCGFFLLPLPRADICGASSFFIAAALSAMPPNASNPAGCSGFVSRPGASGCSAASDSVSNVRISASGLGFDPLDAASRSAVFTASASARRCVSLAPRTSADRPSSAAICALRRRSPVLIRVERRSRVPVDLVDRPRHHGRLRQRLHALGVVAGQRFRESRPIRDEAVERPLIQVVNFRIERGHPDIMCERHVTCTGTP